MLYVSQSLNDRLSMEAFYQLEWDQTIIDNCGTFFSGADVAADGCDSNYNVGSAALAGAVNSPLGAYAAANGVSYTSEGVMIPRGGDRDARDSGQFGLALRWLGDATEYGFYFMNYHSRTPILSSQTAGLPTFGTAQTVGAVAGDAAGTTAFQEAIAAGLPMAQAAALAAQVGAQAGEAVGGAILLGNGQYFLEYPEDIRLYGMSFSTTLPTGTAWSGEISYRPNAPIQINTTDVTLNLTNPGRAGLDNRGYNRKEITQFQTTFTHFFDQVLGADRVTVVGELGYAHVGGLESTSDVRYGRDANFGTTTDALALAANGRHGFVTANSWGYRLRALADYSNVFAGVNLTPNVSFSHDVDGYGPNGLFNEGSKAVSLGVDAVYQNTYTASLSYTDFFGGDFNMLTDRDFLALSVGVNF